MMTAVPKSLLFFLGCSLTLAVCPNLVIGTSQQPPTGDIESVLDQTGTLPPIPDWVEKEPYTVAGETFLVAKTEERFLSAKEADEALDSVIPVTVQQYLKSKLGLEMPDLEITAADLTANWVVPGNRLVHRFDEPYSKEMADRYGSDHDTYYRAFAQIKLDETILADISRQLHRRKILYRLRMTGLFGSGTLVLLSLLYGYFRIEQATRGFYNRRLQTIVVLLAALILGAVCWGIQLLNGV